jgi:hypothetical protein
MQLETGRITDAEFDAKEKILLDRLEAIDSRQAEEDSDEESAGAETKESGESHQVLG